MKLKFTNSIVWLTQLLLLLVCTQQFNCLAREEPEFLIKNERLPKDRNFLPNLANGHMGFTVFGDAIYVNGYYNGEGGNSRRARLPNWLNWNVYGLLSKTYMQSTSTLPTEYSWNLKNGYFSWQMNCAACGELQLEQRIYAHRYYNRALVYELLAQRRNATEALILKLRPNAGNESVAFDFEPMTVNSSIIVNNTEVPHSFPALKGITRIVEHAQFQPEPRTIHVLFSQNYNNHRLLSIDAGQRDMYYRFIITIDEQLQVAVQEMQNVLQLSQQHLLKTHATEWQNFWSDFRINLIGNLELSHIINAGIFAIASSLPSQHSNQGNNAFYGLSPTGLARGQSSDDYQGHNFWDTEIWMFPMVQQFSPIWAKALLQYRYDHLAGAQYNANITGYKGARFPWESAYTGTEVTQPDYPEIAAQQVHISADIAFAVEKYFVATNDMVWLCQTGWPLLREIAIYLESRVVWREQTQYYHVEDVMGPDEDHQHVTDNVYTNAMFKKAFEFASFAEQACQSSTKFGKNWLNIAQKLFILYDQILDYHPQYLDYELGTPVKQADTILLGYPLQWPMQLYTRWHDFKAYEAVTRATGPAMTWSMFAINALDLLDVFYRRTADHYFQRSYKDYVRPDFKVWSETILGYPGSVNFITGVGGFLQAIVHGYAGVRLQRDGRKSVMILKPRLLLPETRELCIEGLKFADFKFGLRVRKDHLTDFWVQKQGRKNAFISWGSEKIPLREGFRNTFASNQTITIQTT